jgi:hypothetical protein
MHGTLALFQARIFHAASFAVGHEFAFPIDYSTNKHWELTSSPTSVESYSRDLATRLSALREVAHLLVCQKPFNLEGVDFNVDSLDVFNLRSVKVSFYSKI